MDNSIDQQFVEYVVKSLVSNPDAVKIDRRIDEKGVLLELTVDPEDLGRVIGKRGATAQSLRTLLRALGTKNEARYNLKIIDNGEPRPERTQRNDDDSSRRDDTVNTASSDNVTASNTTSDDSSADSSTSSVTPADADELVEDVEVKPRAEEPEADDLASKTRKELADLDDLDI